MFSLVVALCVPAQASEDPLAAFKRAEEHFAADRPALAEPLYQAALKAKDAFTVRRSYERLMALYIKSARADKAVRIAGPFREWLNKVGDAATTRQLDVVCGECYLELALYDEAEAAFAAALTGKADLLGDFTLRAYRGRVEVARGRRTDDVRKRWQELEDAAAAIRRAAGRDGDVPLRIAADRERAEAVNARGDAALALALLAELPALHDKLGDPLGRRDTQRLRANVLAAGGRYAEAVPFYREAIDVHKRNRPKLQMVVGDILVDWSIAAAAAGKRTEATDLRTQAAAEYQAIITASSATKADAADPESAFGAFVKLQLVTSAARQFRKALDLSREAGERWAGDQIVDGRLSRDQGLMELLTASYPVARDLLQKSLKELEAADPPDLRAVTLVLTNLSAAELALGNADEAERYVARCDELYRTRGLPDDPVRALNEYHAGWAAMMRGGFADAVARFRTGLIVCDRVGAGTDPIRFNLWLNVAIIYKEQGEFPAASGALEQAAKSLAKFAESGDITVGWIAAVRASIELYQGKLRSAMAHVPHIEAACEANGITGGYLVSTARHVRARDKLDRRDLTAAAKIWTEEAARQRKERDVQLDRSLNYMGIVSELQGRDTEAKAFFEEARSFQASLRRCPPVNRCLTLWRLSVLADKAGNRADAKKLAAEVFDVADRARLNTFGEAAQRAEFYSQFNPVFEQLARWHARDGEADGLLRVITRSRSRTLLDQVLAAGVDPRDRLTGPDRETLLRREGTVRQLVSQLRAKAQFLAADDPTAKDVVAKLDAAQKEYADAWREIVNADPVTRALTDRGMTDGTPTGLPKDPNLRGTAVLAYIVGRDESYAVLSLGGDRPAELFKLVVPQQLAEAVGDVPPGRPTYVATRRGIVVVPLQPQPEQPPPAAGPRIPLTGTAATRLVDHYLRQITDEAFTPARGIAIVPKSPAGPVKAARAETLGDVALPAALRDRLRAGGAERLVVIPDGAFHKIPFECLVVSTAAGPRYALDELPPMVYAPSPAVLAAVMARPKPTGPTTLLTVGDPAYGQGGKADDNKVARRDAGAINFRGSLPPLPFSSVESRRIGEVFAKEQVTSLVGDRATEKAVVGAMADKRFVHLAAHGFADERFGNLFAAVALAPPQGGASVADDDGFLSLHEIHRLRLTGCELTVLSACTTNVGPQRPLEAGVTLAGAFLCAGSRRVVASCWSVDDQATAEMMATYFKLVKPGRPGGMPYPEAMKAARLAVRSTRGWESPFYWASFVFVGAPD
jgi:CHAT domain-containing protein/tetratricopeptide (TPR) repeat protein